MTQTNTDDVHIAALHPLLSPMVLMAEYPVSEHAAAMITEARQRIEQINKGKDDRLLVVVGPCSIHDPDAALEYAHRLKAVVGQFDAELMLVMRAYLEKPRTTVGWKGLLNDPDLDGSFNINRGLTVARQLLSDIAALGLPVGCEFLDTISPQFIADLVSWGAIGARTTESQVHRELASGLSMPVGFKNGTDGNIKIAVDAVKATSYSHHFLSITKQGVAAIVATEGNSCCHVILRGSNQGPNYDAASIQATIRQLQGSGLPPHIMVDCSHGNSCKDYLRQPIVVAELAQQIAAGNRAISGVMLESHLFAGNQPEPKAYGVSITDACIAWGTTVATLETLAAAVRARRL